MLSILGAQSWIASIMYKKYRQGVDDVDQADMVHTVACRVDDMADGEMRQIDLGEGKALLVKDQGQFFAVGAKCTHYGAPLHTGAYCNGRVRCPWHGACFNVKSGDIEDFPGLESIPQFKVKVESGEVKVWGRKQQLETFRRTKWTAEKDPNDSRVFVIVGGGGAGSSCAETLRQEGFTGRIIIINQESHLPYDRTKLSKMLDAKPSFLEMRKPEDYQKFGIELMLGKKVSGLDVNAKTITLDRGETVKYDKVLFSTGGSPRSLGLPGEDLQNVCLLRRVEDGNYIASSSQGQKVVVIGTSFIGLEMAAFMLEKGKASSVTIVGRSEVPLKMVLGHKVGVVVRTLLENKGAKFLFSNPPTEFIGADGKLSGVKLSDGTILEADLCIIGAGVKPSTIYLKDSGVKLSEEGYIVTNKQMMTSVKDVYAAGDITKFPLFLINDDLANIQHWQMSIKQGRTAGLNMAGKDTDLHSVPFFWTMILGKGIRCAGYGAGYDDVIIQGSLEEYKFIAYYTKGDKVVAVATMGSDPVAAQAAEMMFNQIPLLKQDVINDSSMPPEWSKKLAKFSK